MHVILNGKPFDEVDSFMYLGRKRQLIEDVKRMWYIE